MNRFTVLFVFFALSTSLFSQESKVSVALSYPLAADGNFIGENYDGIIDAELKYRVAYLEKTIIGASLNTALLKNEKNGFIFPTSDLTAFVIQPKLYVEGRDFWKSIISPFAGIGYMFIVYDFSLGEPLEGSIDSSAAIPSSSDTQSGLNLNGGFYVNITEKLFFQIQYDFVRLFSEKKIPNFNYNRDVHLAKFGVGYRFGSSPTQQAK